MTDYCNIRISDRHVLGMVFMAYDRHQELAQRTSNELSTSCVG